MKSRPLAEELLAIGSVTAGGKESQFSSGIWHHAPVGVPTVVLYANRQCSVDWVSSKRRAREGKVVEAWGNLQMQE